MPEDKIKNAIEHEKLEASIRALQIQISTNADIQGIILKGIAKGVGDTLEETKKTNGRITLLEADMMIIRILKKHRWLFGIVILGLLKAYEMIDIKEIYEKLLNIII